MVAREQREYAVADRILVLSSFARDSFEEEGCASSRLVVLPLGVDVAAFRPSDDARAARTRRIRSGQPLRVLYVGSLSARKGLLDLVETADRLAGERIEFRLVGGETRESRALLARARGNVTRVGRVAQADLPSIYHQSDVFLFPTIEDGFGLVLTQAKAAGLPIISTNHCAGPDLLTEGQDGWVLPIRSPEAMTERLRWCDRHRDQLASMAEAVAATYRPPDWRAVAAGFTRLSASCLAQQASRKASA
jgi:glycosyltransferase involved in cell wall biosynthesis